MDKRWQIFRLNTKSGCTSEGSLAFFFFSFVSSVSSEEKLDVCKSLSVRLVSLLIGHHPLEIPKKSKERGKFLRFFFYPRWNLQQNPVGLDSFGEKADMPLSRTGLFSFVITVFYKSAGGGLNKKCVGGGRGGWWGGGAVMQI